MAAMSSGSPFRTADNGRARNISANRGAGAVPDAAPRQGDTVLQVVGHLIARHLFHNLPDLPGQGAFDGRVEV